LSFSHQGLAREADVSDETGKRRAGLDLGKAQDVGCLVDLAPVAIEDALMGVVGQEDRDFGGGAQPGAGLREGFEDGGFGDGVEAFGPVAGLDVDGDLERRDGAQLALSSLAVAPS
jgi:hypothetical protein